MIYTLEDFIREYRKIKEMGWIRTHRAGPTGVGKTLEDLLGIEENNHDAPDFGEYELKSCRVNSQSMLTMFTKTPQPPKANTYLRLKYGYSSSAYDNEEKVLHSTLTAAHFVPYCRYRASAEDRVRCSENFDRIGTRNRKCILGAGKTPQSV